HGQLPAPQNVTLLSKDFDMILTWTPGEGSPPDVLYTVKYESKGRMDKWIKVPHCKNIHSISCNLTCVIPNFFIKFRARVKATSGRLHSPWVKSQFKEYHLDAEWKFPFSAIVPVLVLLIILASVSTIWLLKQDAKHKKKPQALVGPKCWSIFPVQSLADFRIWEGV
ncbi:UNVERIFIED_CONTAM: hypothetical protein H355_000519, partial [Colinus virginianus]